MIFLVVFILLERVFAPPPENLLLSEAKLREYHDFQGENVTILLTYDTKPTYSIIFIYINRTMSSSTKNIRILIYSQLRYHFTVLKYG